MILIVIMLLLIKICKKRSLSYECKLFLAFLFKSIYNIHRLIFAGVAELADAPDLGSGGNTVQVQVLSPAP